MFKTVCGFLTVCAFLLLLLDFSEGHGMVMDPVSRGSRWRVNSSAPINYDDNGNFCGGFYVHHSLNGGKCGVCGDDYAKPRPRAHEIGGYYGQQGVIVKSYPRNGVLPVSVLITANHKGYFYFNLCDLSTSRFEMDDCFARYPLKTTQGNLKHFLGSEAVGYYNVTLQLPTNLSCKRCVLQWTYNVGNNWGICEDGSGKLGCGAQENFRTCSDIAIL